MTGKEIVALALEREQEDQKIYTLYMNATDNLGLKNLLKSLIDQEKEHEKKLHELEENPEMDILQIPLSPEKYRTKTVFSKDMSCNNFLNLVIDREELGAAFYSDISSEAGNEEIGFLFTSLAFDEQKHKNWAVNRYELEMLSSF